MNAGPVGPGVVHTSTFLDAATNVSPWPPNPTGLYPIPMTGPATIVPGNWSANFALANATSQDVEYWLTTVAIGSTSQTWLDLNSVNGIVVGDSLALVDSNSGGSWTVAGVDPILNRVSTVESVTNVPLGAHIYWATSSQTEMVMEDPRLILSMADHLGLRVVAEGVETREQADFLLSHGCDAVQGYLLARPLPMMQWLHQLDGSASPVAPSVR